MKYTLMVLTLLAFCATAARADYPIPSLPLPEKMVATPPAVASAVRHFTCFTPRGKAAVLGVAGKSSGTCTYDTLENQALISEAFDNLNILLIGQTVVIASFLPGQSVFYPVGYEPVLGGGQYKWNCYNGRNGDQIYLNRRCPSSNQETNTIRNDTISREGYPTGGTGSCGTGYYFSPSTNACQQCWYGVCSEDGKSNTSSSTGGPWQFPPPTSCPSPTTPYPCQGQGCPYYYWNTSSCSWQTQPPTSPILIDTAGTGDYGLTAPADGVEFSGLAPAGRKVSWTPPDSTLAFLVHDVNENGVIDDASELFGDKTSPVSTLDPNGFKALAFWDSAIAGGNGDGRMGPGDAIFDGYTGATGHYHQLQLWFDLNHDGISQASELKTLQEYGILGIDLDYKEKKKTDQYGNQFKYRGKAWGVGGQKKEKIWDVFLASE